MNRVLIVEDEVHLAQGLRFNLEAEGYNVNVVETGEEALSLLINGSESTDLVILDVMLPGIDGFEVVRTLRSAGRFVPVLVLTARGRPDDVLQGFEAGADDYLPKPFELAILLARLRGLLRRRQWLEQAQDVSTRERYEFAGKVIDFSSREVWAHSRVLPLTLMEANLLRYLVQHEGEVVTRRALLADVWGVRETMDTRAIDNFVVRLRRYLEDDPAQPQHLLTKRGVGYKFVAQPRST